MNHLVQRGWLCVDINYRLSPRHKFPAHIIDVKRAIAWVRAHIADYGGDPAFIALTGESAGGHLCALAALTPNLAEFQPGFEQADTRVDAAVPVYGVFDWQSSISPEDLQFRGWIARHVLHEGEDPATSPWLEKASPVNYVRADAPPMFFVHGTHDALAKVEDARFMVRRLRAVSVAPVVYAEIPWAQHAFELFYSIRAQLSAQAVGEFLEWSRARVGA
jgi:acetyl esterase/lipase